MRVEIGTAGYAYPAWKPEFYPPGLASAEFLPFYARHFPVVEINSTFYRPPTAAQVTRMLRLTPEKFAYLFKIPRSASHDGETNELYAFVAGVRPAWDAGRLRAVLIQFPETFRRTLWGERWLGTVQHAVQPIPLAVEFRHVSWDDPTTLQRIGQRGISIVGVGVPDLAPLFPPGPRPGCGPIFYARLHGENPENWYAGGELRYSYDYPDATLAYWRQGLLDAAELGTAEAVVLFNNCVGIQAIENARRLRQLLANDRTLEVAAAPPARVRSLFDE
jgi:uncharacterized protein YecE (DUF72 family)